MQKYLKNYIGNYWKCSFPINPHAYWMLGSTATQFDSSYIQKKGVEVTLMFLSEHLFLDAPQILHFAKVNRGMYNLLYFFIIYFISQKWFDNNQ